MKKITLLLPLIFSLASTSISAASNENELSLRKSFPIQLYMGNCVINRGQSSKIEEQALKMGFTTASEEIAKPYLQGQKGKVWLGQNQHGKFAVASLANGLCSVFIHQGNPEILQASMESWLPPQNSGFSYKKELVSQSKELTTTAYKLFRGDSFMEQWVITVANNPNSNLKAIMSYFAK